jgi:hypothetical protein
MVSSGVLVLVKRRRRLFAAGQRLALYLTKWDFIPFDEKLT